MSSNIPESFQIQYSHEDIQNRIKSLGEEITTWAEQVHKDTGNQILAICILRGGVYFFADILRAINYTVEPTFCRTWSYSSVENIQKKAGIKVAVDDVEANGRSILMIDDICDTGSTLLKLQNVFSDLGAAEIRSAVFIHRKVDNPIFQPTWSGFEYEGDEWFVGYGMEDKNAHSNLPGSYIIKQ